MQLLLIGEIKLQSFHDRHGVVRGRFVLILVHEVQEFVEPGLVGAEHFGKSHGHRDASILTGLSANHLGFSGERLANTFMLPIVTDWQHMHACFQARGYLPRLANGRSRAQNSSVRFKFYVSNSC